MFPVGSLFRLRVSHHLGRATFPAPPRRTQHADFPHCALLFASPQGLWGLSCRSGFRRWSNHSVAIEQLQSLVQPSPLHRAQPKPCRFRARSMAPDLLLHPVFHEAEALAGVSHRKVVHPTAQHRVDQLHDPINRLRLVAAEHILELARVLRGNCARWVVWATGSRRCATGCRVWGASSPTPTSMPASGPAGRSSRAWPVCARTSICFVTTYPVSDIDKLQRAISLLARVADKICRPS